MNRRTVCATATANSWQGLREIMEQLRQQRRERLERSDLGGVYQEIADELGHIVDEERHAIENAVRERGGLLVTSVAGSRPRRSAADERNFRLDASPTTSPGKARELSAYHFELAEAPAVRAADGEMAKQLMQQMVDQRRRRCRTCP